MSALSVEVLTCSLSPDAMRLLDHTLADLAEGPEGLEAELAYSRLVALLPPHT